MQTFNGVQSYGIVLILSQIEIIPDMILIVMPILALLMFLLGLGLKREAFRQVAAEPLSLVVGLVGQIIFLPLCAFAVASLMNLPPIYFIGLMLVAASPGGSSRTSSGIKSNAAWMAGRSDATTATSSST